MPEVRKAHQDYDPARSPGLAGLDRGASRRESRRSGSEKRRERVASSRYVGNGVICRGRLLRAGRRIDCRLTPVVPDQGLSASRTSCTFRIRSPVVNGF